MDSFGSSDAGVACRQLGYSSIQYGTVGALGFSQASSYTVTWPFEVSCLGTESTLIDCPSTIIESCYSNSDVALICYSTTPSTSPTSSSINFSGIGIGVTVLVIIIIVVGVVLFSVFARRRRRLARYPRSTPLINNVASTAVVVTASNTQDTAYPVRNLPPYSPQAPSQNMQPAAAYPTGQYADPQYHTSYPQQPPTQYPMSNPQQPLSAPSPTSYPQQPPAPYPQKLPAPYSPGEQPPSAPYLYGGEAPPAYLN
ncbi:protein shisa-5-like [Halichondria panicea]|uniref:protein shisa-5-like n=1 Tax=Halichondria panicea TaxID=6063 RepID=UPI00312B949C